MPDADLRIGRGVFQALKPFGSEPLEEPGARHLVAVIAEEHGRRLDGQGEPVQEPDDLQGGLAFGLVAELAIGLVLLDQGQGVGLGQFVDRQEGAVLLRAEEVALAQPGGGDDMEPVVGGQAWV